MRAGVLQEVRYSGGHLRGVAFSEIISWCYKQKPSVGEGLMSWCHKQKPSVGESVRDGLLQCGSDIFCGYPWVTTVFVWARGAGSKCYEELQFDRFLGWGRI